MRAFGTLIKALLRDSNSASTRTADAALFSAKEAGRNRISGFTGRRRDDVADSLAAL